MTAIRSKVSPGRRSRTTVRVKGYKRGGCGATMAFCADANQLTLGNESRNGRLCAPAPELSKDGWKVTSQCRLADEPRRGERASYSV